MIPRGLGREVVLAAACGVVLASILVLPSWWEGLIAPAMAMLLLVPWTWRRHANEWLRPRLAATFINAFAGGLLTALAVTRVGESTVVLAVTVVAAGLAGLERARLRGAPVPAEGEPHGRVVFEGTLHAVGDPPLVPGTDRAFPVWCARQGRRRWASPAPIELRDEHRKVWIEPGAARLRAPVWLLSEGHARAAARELGGDTARGFGVTGAIRVASFGEGAHVHVVGRATLEDDPTAPSFRDPGRVHVFRTDLLIGAGRLADARHRAHVRLVMWSALALCAGGLALVNDLARLGS